MHRQAPQAPQAPPSGPRPTHPTHPTTRRLGVPPRPASPACPDCPRSLRPPTCRDRVPAQPPPQAPNRHPVRPVHRPRLRTARLPLRPGPHSRLARGRHHLRVRAGPPMPAPSPVQAGPRLATDTARTGRPDLAHPRRTELHHHPHLLPALEHPRRPSPPPRSPCIIKASARTLRGAADAGHRGWPGRQPLVPDGLPAPLAASVRAGRQPAQRRLDLGQPFPRRFQ